MSEESKYIWVISGRKDDRVALYEKNAAHPVPPGGTPDEGEAYVAGSRPVEVGVTPLVAEKIRNGQLIEVKEPPKKLQAEAPKPTETEQANADRNAELDKFAAKMREDFDKRMEAVSEGNAKAIAALEKRVADLQEQAGKNSSVTDSAAHAPENAAAHQPATGGNPLPPVQATEGTNSEGKGRGNKGGG